jgi:predicted nucleotidyltransferase
VQGLGSDRHQALIDLVVVHYEDDPRVRAVVVFGSVATGRWHRLSDVDLDVVIGDGVVVSPAVEVGALFGGTAAIVLARSDSVDLVLDSLDEISIRWHPLATTSPNITSSARVVSGRLAMAEVVAAGEANRVAPDAERLLDQLVRHAIGAAKAISRGEGWDANSQVDRVRDCLVSLRGRRDSLQLDPARPDDSLATVINDVMAELDLGSRRRSLLEQAGIGTAR